MVILYFRSAILDCSKNKILNVTKQTIENAIYVYYAWKMSLTEPNFSAFVRGQWFYSLFFQRSAARRQKCYHCKCIYFQQIKDACITWRTKYEHNYNNITMHFMFANWN